jgi:hypothetical protein
MGGRYGAHHLNALQLIARLHELSLGLPRAFNNAAVVH